MVKIIALGKTDSILPNLASSFPESDITWIDNYKQLENHDTSIPVLFRGMAQRKLVKLCEQQGRDYYYIDTGYIGNLNKRKDWHRVVKNGMQHSKVRYDMPGDRFNLIAQHFDYLQFKKWHKTGDNILVVTPSEKPCKFYGIDRDTWVETTLNDLQKYTDRKIIVRDKSLRRDRVGSGSIYQQFVNDKIYCVVTYNSIAATEAIGFGIPAFTFAPNAADPFCLKDLSKIEDPYYADPEKVIKWQHWLAYCQYTSTQLRSGKPFEFMERYDLG